MGNTSTTQLTQEEQIEQVEKIKINGTPYLSLTSSQKVDENIALIFANNINNYALYVDSLKKNVNFNVKCIKKNSFNYFEMSQDMQKNFKIKCAAAQKISLMKIDKDWYNDREFLIYLLGNVYLKDVQKERIDEEIYHDEEACLQIIKDNIDFMNLYKGEKSDKFYRKALEINPFIIEKCPERFKDDYDIMMKVLVRCGLLYAYTSDRLKNNLDIILEAVKENSDAMSHVPKKFRNDKVVMMEVVRKQPMALYYASEKLKSDLDVVIPAVHMNYQCQIYLSYEFRSTTPVYLASRRMYLGLVYDEKIKNLAKMNFKYQ
eukprot:gene3281-5723_t